MEYNENLSKYLKFKNGKKRLDSFGVYPLYGGNGKYGTSSNYNTEYSIIIGRVGAYCGSVYLSESKCWVSDNAISAQLVNDEDDLYYFYYLLKMLNLNFYSVGTSQPLLTQNILKNLKVNIAGRKNQKIISDILLNYDKKIETNNKIIANLEAQAQALFKYYFVDFEPFRDGKFIDSDLGPIPEGWGIVELSDVADFRNGYSFKSKELDDKKIESNYYRVFKMGDISVGGGFNLGKTRSWVSKEFIEEKNISRYIIDYGDLLMCMTDMKDNVRLLGHVAFNWFDDEYILNQRVGRITSKSKEITNEYLYFLINSDKFIQELRGRANRGVQVNLSTKEIKASKLLVPNTPYLDKYNKFISKIMKYNGYLTKQNQTLAQTRDALLPKLMAGEIDLEKIGESYD